ncbi:N-acetylglucosamine-6-phosphate deacetylase [Proteiniclasticum sp. SCR006]|uniref:N-acetylglucosamine-6-phosphate deacetylase n=1 Tax=Proteiniclasticum aestuarii TaxID=2817862 RepID=A0A939H8G2_9CLOT|nr:N-acetylglucosamine-6-phosphate deacetylase [Proteiniclasticum aestuarii]MBO1263913.1 N-acetylglucosamine-6-phosphate deacetylase [Proteiniclasticum aestuarii]
MIFKDFRVIFTDRIETMSVQIRNGKITSFNPDDADDEVIEGKGRYLSPGFIDIHIHGAGNHDTMEGTFDALETISKTIAEYGTTTFLPTTMTVDTKEIRKAVEAAKVAQGQVSGASIGGVHLEGPFISEGAIGAQNPKYVQKPTLEAFKEMVGNNLDLIKNITMAPEVEGALELIPYLRENGINVSMGHSVATYEEAMEGIRAGVNHSTHLFNAMTPFTHRKPGVVGAIFDTDITTETISDGIHVSYPSLRTAYKIKTSDKVLLITDAMMACGMPDGTYSLGGQAVISKEGAARLTSGALAGSILTMDKAVKNVFEHTDLPLHEVIKMASYNGALFIGAEKITGKIALNYDADLLILSDDLKVEHVFIKGKQFK